MRHDTIRLARASANARPAGAGAAQAGTLRQLIEGQTAIRCLLTRFALMRCDGPEADPDRAQLVCRLNAELCAYLHVKEELLFPRMRDAVGDGAPIDQAEVEHECLRHLLDRLQGMEPGDPLFDARVMVLGQLFESHLQRELGQLLPLLCGANLRGLGRTIAERREEMLDAARAGQQTLQFENEEADPVGERPS